MWVGHVSWYVSYHVSYHVSCPVSWYVSWPVSWPQGSHGQIGWLPMPNVLKLISKTFYVVKKAKRARFRELSALRYPLQPKKTSLSFLRQSEDQNSVHRPCWLTCSPGNFGVCRWNPWYLGYLYKKLYSQNIIGTSYGSYFDISFCGETLRTSTLRFWPAWLLDIYTQHIHPCQDY